MDNEIRVEWFDWWRGDVISTFESQYNLKLDHANWGENFPFNRVAESPDEIKPPVNLALLEGDTNPREVMGDGSFGGAYQIDDALILTLFDQIVEDVVERLRALRTL